MKKQKITPKIVEKRISLEDAVQKIKENSKSKFVGTISLEMSFNLKESQKKEVIRGSFVFPKQFSAAKVVAVVCEEKDVQIAKNAGAKYAGLDIVEKIEKNEIIFDVLLATPDTMSKLVKLSKILGPKGLMPNPKNGTVSSDVEKSVKSFVAGKENFKSHPEQGAIRLKVGKLDMDTEHIIANIKVAVNAILAETKKFGSGVVKKIILSPTMGAGVKLSLSDII